MDPCIPHWFYVTSILTTLIVLFAHLVLLIYMKNLGPKVHGTSKKKQTNHYSSYEKES